MLWQREQITTGLRDAVRYVARCHTNTDPDTDPLIRDEAACDATARNIAYYGSVSGSGTLRVPGWDAATSPITIIRTSQAAQDVVTASTTHTILHSPLFGFLGIDDITVTLDHQQRDIGW
ncbi:hypothetical protein QW131_18365 [Roseibium salinum]|nr:hypothetical protein [Roseibium salinum]